MILEYIISTIAPHLCLLCRVEGTLLCKGLVLSHSRGRPKGASFAITRRRERYILILAAGVDLPCPLTA